MIKKIKAGYAWGYTPVNTHAPIEEIAKDVEVVSMPLKMFAIEVIKERKIKKHD